MNIAKGESLEYAIEMILSHSKMEVTISKSITEAFLKLFGVNILRKDTPGAKLIVAYDIFCKLRENSRFNIDLGFIPEMHAYNHIESYQVKSYPKQMLVIGIKYGEDCLLRNVIFQTSVMRNEKRCFNF